MNSVERLAGRELDALVAEKVMGWQRMVRPDYDWAGHEWRIGGLGSGGIHLPSFSTDIAAAWEVVAEMERRGWSCVIATNACANGRQNGVKFYEGWRSLGYSIFDGEPHPGHTFVAETIPRAICHAAVAALAATTEGSQTDG
jgi:hypothetical protein